MARPSFAAESRKKEGIFLKHYFSLAKVREPALTQAGLMRELGLDQSLLSNWFKGRTRVPDGHLISLGYRLGFNPFELRSEMVCYVGLPVFEADVVLHEKMRKMTYEQRQIVHKLIGFCEESFALGLAARGI